MPDRAHLSRFYPIAADSWWAARIMAHGAKTLQLRVKSEDEIVVRAMIVETLQMARKYGCQLIVNDHWKIAIDEGADFIHLGQEDLAAADMKAIRRAKLRVGVSTHDEEELEIALRAEADYVAFGPVYSTKLKQMRFAPQGPDRVRSWKERVGAAPLVAIGGMTLDRAPAVIAAGADSIAVITDFVAHPDPDAQLRRWVHWNEGDTAV
ncbi:MAG: thiamine phosphate synthase [Hyphomicrobium sp.]